VVTTYSKITTQQSFISPAVSCTDVHHTSSNRVVFPCSISRALFPIQQLQSYCSWAAVAGWDPTNNRSRRAACKVISTVQSSIVGISINIGPRTVLVILSCGTTNYNNTLIKILKRHIYCVKYQTLYYTYTSLESRNNPVCVSWRVQSPEKFSLSCNWISLSNSISIAIVASSK
jgi:hypothetical protein